MPHPLVPAPLQHVEETHQVAVYVGVGVLQRIAHTGLSRHVGHPVEALSLKETFHPLPVRQVQPDKAEIFPLLQQVPACLLEAHVVVGVEIVQTYDLISALQQPPRQMETDEARRPGYKYPCHARILAHRAVLRTISRYTGPPTPNPTPGDRARRRHWQSLHT